MKRNSRSTRHLAVAHRRARRHLSPDLRRLCTAPAGVTGRLRLHHGVNTTKADPYGLGSLAEEVALTGKFFVPKDQKITDPGQI